MADSTIPGLVAIAAPLAAADLLSVRRGGQTRNEKAAMTDLAAVLAAAGPAPLAGYGTVTSVGLTAPSWLTIGGTPVIGAGTLQITATPAQTAAQVLATSGTAASIVNLRALTKEHLTGAGATAGAVGAVQLAGDLGGTATAPTVMGVNGVALPVGVASGGSGLATLATYALLAGGTTATGALQQVSGLGTAGQVLTSNGAAALPTWQAVAGGGANTALSNLAAVAINAPLATGAGVVFAGSTTAAAATASTTAGVGLTITADAAVAGTTNAGAAQGGSVTYTAGAAARLTSGNARGGSHILIPGAGIGTGLTGYVAIGGDTSSFPALYQRPGNQDLELVVAGGTNSRNNLWANSIRLNTTAANYGIPVYLVDPNGAGFAVGLSQQHSIGWVPGSDASQSKDTSLSRAAAGSVSLDTTTRANGLGRVWQRTSTAANPTTTEYPNDKDWGIHKNTASGAIFLAHNNGGTIVSVQLS
jgi:hypothetical protein